MRFDLVAVLVFVFVVTSALPAQAHSPYKVRLAVDLPLTLGLIGGATAFELTAPETARLSCHPCSADDLLFSLDRGVVGPAKPTLARVTHVGVSLIMVSPFVLSGLDELLGTDQPSREAWLVDSAVIAETLAATLVLTQIVKHLVRRPRPFTFAMSIADSSEVEFDATLSFYSSHTAMAFASVVAALQTLHRRGHRGPRFAVTAGVGLALATGVGLGRVGAARHFWTDVMTGAAAGSLVGWLVPWLHVQDDETDEGGEPGLEVRAAPLGVAGTF